MTDTDDALDRWNNHLIGKAADRIDAHNEGRTDHAALDRSGHLWIAALLDEIARLAIACNRACESEARLIYRLNRRAPRTIHTPTEAEKLPHTTVAVDARTTVYVRNKKADGGWLTNADDGRDASTDEIHFPATVVYNPLRRN